MVEVAGEDRDWQAANDGVKWLVNADSKGLTTGQTPKWAYNGLWLTISQTSKGSTMGQGQLGAKNKNKKKMSPLGRLSNRSTKPDQRMARVI
jgi:hypothetical protein